jgi:hypothetical protein
LSLMSARGIHLLYISMKKSVFSVIAVFSKAAFTSENRKIPVHPGRNPLRRCNPLKPISAPPVSTPQTSIFIS